MLIAIVIAVYTFALTSQKCNNGCLRCSSKDECQLCDITNNFALNGTACIATQIDNCQRISNSGICLGCNAPYYLNETGGKCAQVETRFQIDSCSGYSSKQVCLGCTSGLFLSEGKCVPVTIQIDNCDFFSGDGICSACKQNYFLSIDGSGCLVKSPDDNCLKYTTVECSACANGYFLDPNLFTYKYSNDLSAIIKWAESKTLPQTRLSSQRVCSQANLENCLEPLNAKKCKTCKDGHFLADSGLCKKNPTPLITNCNKYLSESTCGQCIDGYFLFSATSCLPVVSIENCSRYDPASFESRCTECNKDFVVNGNECVKRVQSINIANCAGGNPVKDECLKCSDNFVLVANKLTCLAAVANCKSYMNLSGEDGSLVCKECVDLYYLQDGICIIGTVDNCFTYSEGNTCKTCKDGYFLTNSICEAQPPLSNCSKYHSAANMTCTTCSNSTTLFSLQNFCVPTISTPNCASFNSTGYCVDCRRGYYLADVKCNLIPSTSSNCNIYTAGTVNACTSCNNGFVLDVQTGACLKPHAYQTRYCGLLEANDSKFTGGTLPACKYCARNSIPLNLKNYFICIEKNYLKYAGITNSIANCTRYDSTGTCFQCAFGLVVTVLGECKEACEGTNVLILNDFTSGRSKFCVAPSVPNIANCKVAVRRSSGYACIRLSDGFPLVAMSDKTLIPFRLNETDPQPSYLNYEGFLITPTINNLVTLDENCELYYTTSATTGCLKCKHGYTGALSGSFISTCIENLECDLSIFYSGLPQYLNKVLSCHVCKTAPRLPLVGVKGNNVDWTSLKVPTGRNLIVSCASKPVTLPDNCAVMFELTDDTTVANSGVFCGACAPGFLPTYLTGTNKVTSCSEITNCQSNSRLIFNSCTRCSSGSSFTALATSPWIDFTKCTTNTFSNCMVLNNDILSCKYCLPGFQKNKDGECEILTIPYCDIGKSQPVYSSLSFSEYYILSYFAPLTGCTGCTGETVAVKETKDNSVCVQSSILTNGVNTPSNFYISNCIHHWESDSKYLCMVCQDDFILTADKSACVTKILNCSFAKSDIKTFCETCQEKFINVAGVCVAGDVKNCRLYNPTSDASPKCTACEKGFYLVDEMSCLPGYINNCEAYPNMQPLKCTQCRPGYQLVTNSQQSTFCFPIDLTLKCKRFDPVLFGQNVLSCVECSDPQTVDDPVLYPGSIPAALPFRTICMRYPTMANCTEHDRLNFVSLNNYRCVECAFGFKFNPTTVRCDNRTVVIDKCSKYANAFDLCEQCEDKFMLDSTKTKCIPYPSGVPGCIQYSDENTCKVCDSKSYIKNNACVPVPELISKCAQYIFSTDCGKCEPGYVLTKNQCKQAVAKDCLTYVDSNNCATCSPGMGLKTEETITNCVAVTKDKCKNFNQTAPYNCFVCDSGFYANSTTGNCAAVNTTIDSCEVYQAIDRCDVCKSGYVLSIDKKKCLNDLSTLSIMDPNCKTAYLKNQTFCAECAIDSLFVNGTCAKCTTHSDNSGCQSCTDVASTCLICKSGFYMNATTSCIQIGMEQGNSQTNSTSFSPIWRAILESLVLLLLCLI
jgi:hypothetical protein